MDSPYSTKLPTSLVAAIVLVTMWPFLDVGSALVVPLVRNQALAVLTSIVVAATPLGALALTVASRSRGTRLGASRAAVLGIAVAEAACASGLLWITSLQCWSPICGN
jgi:hypothetical protein